MDNRWQKAQKVLVVRLDNLGDVMLCTPAIRAIKETLPRVHITLLASPVGAQVADLNSDIDEAILYQAPWMDVWHSRPQDSDSEQDMIATIKARHFDGAVIFTSFRQSALPAAYLCYLADIPLRLAISIDGSGSLLTTRHRPPEAVGVHEVLRHLDLVRVVGFRASRNDLVLEVGADLRDRVRERLISEDVDLNRTVVVIHPGCSMPARTYPWERYAQVADSLSNDLGYQVIFTGSSDEVELVDRIRQRMETKSSSWAGRASFEELAGLIAVANVVVTNNTGPQHLAAAVKTPVVVQFALTNPPEQWHPWNVPHRLLYRQVPCALCYSRVCPTDHACLLKVQPAHVVSAVAELLNEVGHK